MKNIINLTLCSILVCLTGCASMLKAPQVDMSALKPPGPVTSVVAAWEPAVSNGENSMRGFAGRIYLYDSEMNRPVKAKGTVVVYLFDEDGRSPNDSKPNEGVVFEAKTLNSNGVYQKTRLGHSYKLWIPVDAAGPEGQAKKVSLIVRYIPEKGSSVVSAQSTAQLPGRRGQDMVTTQPDWQIRNEAGQIQQVSDIRSSLERPLSNGRRLTQERTIEANADRPQALQSVTIR